MATTFKQVTFCSALCAQILILGVALAAEDSRNVPDTTPAPLGTASFVPPSNIDQQQLTPESFVIQAAVINMAEIEIGGLAQSRSATASVKAFGSQLIKDHQAALASLKSVAAGAKIALPGELDPENQALRDELARLEGPAFDQRFVAAMASGHAKAVKLFQAASRAPTLTPALHSYAQSTLPALQRHAQMAHELQAAR